MKKLRCPNCGDPSGEFVAKPGKDRYRWYEFSYSRSFCRHCGAEVAADPGFQRWSLLVLPAIVLLVWDVALAGHGGVHPILEYGSWALAAVGLVMLYLKQKLVLVEPPRGAHAHPDEPAAGG